MSTNKFKRIKELEAENARLERMHADLVLKDAAIKGLLSRKL
jgi:putative transposase